MGAKERVRAVSLTFPLRQEREGHGPHDFYWLFFSPLYAVDPIETMGSCGHCFPPFPLCDLSTRANRNGEEGR